MVIPSIKNRITLIVRVSILLNVINPAKKPFNINGISGNLKKFIIVDLRVLVERF